MLHFILMAIMAAAPVSAPIPAPAPAADADKRICRTFGTTGSYFKVKRTCLTKLEWKEFDRGMGKITQGRKDGLIEPHACIPGARTGGCGR